MLAQILLQLQQGQAKIVPDTREGVEELASGFKEPVRRPGTVSVKGIGKPDDLKDLMMRFRKCGSPGARSLRHCSVLNGQEVRKR